MREKPTHQVGLTLATMDAVYEICIYIIKLPLAV
jgi:hypothetical protein